MIKILIASENHLGFEDKSIYIDKQSRFKTLSKIINISAKYDLLIFCGHFFNKLTVDAETTTNALNELSKLEKFETKLLITEQALNLDSENFISISKLKNLIAKNDSLNCYSYEKNGNQINLFIIDNYENFDKNSISAYENTFNVGIIENFISENSEESIDNLNINNFIINNIDFIIFGDSHYFKTFNRQNNIYGLAVGTSDPVTFNETNERYIASLNINGKEIEKIKRLSINSTFLQEETINCTNNKSFDMKNFLNENKSGKKVIKIHFTGKREFPIDVKLLNDMKNEFKKIIINDKSTPSLNALIDSYKNENSLRGEFFKILKSKIEKESSNKSFNIDNFKYIPQFLENLHENDSFSNIEHLEEWLCTLSNA